MNKRKKLWLAGMITGILTLQSAFCAFAENIGPAFDPKLNGGVSTEQSGSSSGSAPSAAPNGTLVDSGNPIYTNPLTNLLPIQREPRLQTTVLLCDSHTWSNPFVNSDTCSVDGKAFYSISTFLENYIGNIHYRAYTSAHGWTNWAMNGQQTDIPDDFAPIEAVQYRFSGPVRNKYDIYYTTTLNDGTQTGWAGNGHSAGTMNTGKTLSGFRLAFFERAGGVPSLNMSNATVSAHLDGPQYIDGAIRYISGDGSNYTGWGWVDAQRYYFNDSYPVTGWQYIDGYKYYFAEDGKLVEDLEPIIGANGPFLIRINKQMNCMTIFVQDGANGYIIPLKSFLTSTGEDTPVGTFHTPEKYRWRLMIHGLYTQYATRLGSGLPILMHSVIYDRQDPFSLEAGTYNAMGVARSSGCIRLIASDCKWIYDHCPIGTAVEVYNSSIVGPYERPTIKYEISDKQDWDPTDDTISAEQAAARAAQLAAQ